MLKMKVALDEFMKTNELTYFPHNLLKKMKITENRLTEACKNLPSFPWSCC